MLAFESNTSKSTLVIKPRILELPEADLSFNDFEVNISIKCVLGILSVFVFVYFLFEVFVFSF